MNRTGTLEQSAFKKGIESLNERQKEAVEHIDGPLLVLAGPGTGKTQLLSLRAAHILKERPVLPENILIMTFTNAGARAMRERLASMLGGRGYRLEVETFHSFANSVVLQSEAATEFVNDRIEMTDTERVRLIEHILDKTPGVEALRPFGSPYRNRKEIEKRISELKNEGFSPDRFSRMVGELASGKLRDDEKYLAKMKALSVIYREYEKLKSGDGEFFDDRGRMDYDDMILIALKAIRSEKALRDEFCERYRYIMVDEYQDTNGVQLELLFSLTDRTEPNICCVGDDDQAIFRFQGATLTNFKVLEQKFPSLEKITLRENYRSSDEMVRVGAELIAQLPEDERIGSKTLVSRKDFLFGGAKFVEFLTEEEELHYIVERVRSLAEEIRRDPSLSDEIKRRPFNDMAVIVRTRGRVKQVVDAFLKAGIPYATDGGEDIRSEKRVRQMLDVLDLASVDPGGDEQRDMALYKVLTADYMGLEHADVIKLIELNLREQKNVGTRGSFLSFFESSFGRFRKDRRGMPIKPSRQESGKLPIAKEEEFFDPHALHAAAWAINRLFIDTNTRPVHDILMRYVLDTSLYSYILKKCSDNKVLRIRELRGLVSFINMVKTADMNAPGLTLGEFSKELKLRERHGMPIMGELATLSQDGVRVITAHKSKGLEFCAVFVPFCLEKRSWPYRGRSEVLPLPAQVSGSLERANERKRRKELKLHDELRLFYVASTRAKAHLLFTATPKEKSIASSFLAPVAIDRENGSPSDEGAFLGEFLKPAREEDSLIPPPRILADMVKTLSLNPTSLNTYITCPRKFLYNSLLRLPTTKNQHIVFGNAAHRALEKVYGRYMAGEDLPGYDTFCDIFERSLLYEGVTEEMKTWCSARLVALRKWYELEVLSPVVPIAIEKKLEIKFPSGLVFRGMFDKIEPDGEEFVKVIDYKTGGPYKHLKAIAAGVELKSHECDDYFRQLVAYKMLYDEALGRRTGKTVSKGVLQFLEPSSKTVKKYALEKGKYIKREFPVSEELVSELRDVIDIVWKRINELDFKRSPERETDPRCKMCDFRSLCWEG